MRCLAGCGRTSLRCDPRRAPGSAAGCAEVRPPGSVWLSSPSESVACARILPSHLPLAPPLAAPTVPKGWGVVQRRAAAGLPQHGPNAPALRPSGGACLCHALIGFANHDRLAAAFPVPALQRAQAARPCPFAHAQRRDTRRFVPDMAAVGSWICIHVGRSSRQLKHRAPVSRIWPEVPERGTLMEHAGAVIGLARIAAIEDAKSEHVSSDPWTQVTQSGDHAWRFDRVLALSEAIPHAGQMRLWWVGRAASATVLDTAIKTVAALRGQGSDRSGGGGSAANPPGAEPPARDASGGSAASELAASSAAPRRDAAWPERPAVPGEGRRQPASPRPNGGGDAWPAGPAESRNGTAEARAGSPKAAWLPAAPDGCRSASAVAEEARTGDWQRGRSARGQRQSSRSSDRQRTMAAASQAVSAHGPRARSGSAFARTSSAVPGPAKHQDDVDEAAGDCVDDERTLGSSTQHQSEFGAGSMMSSLLDSRPAPGLSQIPGMFGGSSLQLDARAGDQSRSAVFGCEPIGSAACQTGAGAAAAAAAAIGTSSASQASGDASLSRVSDLHSDNSSAGHSDVSRRRVVASGKRPRSRSVDSSGSVIAAAAEPPAAPHEQGRLQVVEHHADGSVTLQLQLDGRSDSSRAPAGKGQPTTLSLTSAQVAALRQQLAAIDGTPKGGAARSQAAPRSGLGAGSSSGRRTGQQVAMSRHAAADGVSQPLSPQGRREGRWPSAARLAASQADGGAPSPVVAPAAGRAAWRASSSGLDTLSVRELASSLQNAPSSTLADLMQAVRTSGVAGSQLRTSPSERVGPPLASPKRGGAQAGRGAAHSSANSTQQLAAAGQSGTSSGNSGEPTVVLAAGREGSRSTRDGVAGSGSSEGIAGTLIESAAGQQEARDRRPGLRKRGRAPSTGDAVAGSVPRGGDRGGSGGGGIDGGAAGGVGSRSAGGEGKDGRGRADAVAAGSGAVMETDPFAPRGAKRVALGNRALDAGRGDRVGRGRDSDSSASQASSSDVSTSAGTGHAAGRDAVESSASLGRSDESGSTSGDDRGARAAATAEEEGRERRMRSPPLQRPSA